MPRKRQIPNLFPRTRADGSVNWHWRPSPTLRKAGWTNRALGSDYAAAVAAAIDLNRQVAAWRDGATPASQMPVHSAPRIVRFAELVQRYRTSPEWAQLRETTRREYDVRLRQLAIWAMDGTLAVRDIDADMVRDLRTGLMQGSIHRAASTLRILRLLLNWAMANGIVTRNATDGVKIREPRPRRTRMDEPLRDAITTAAIALGLPDIALAVDLAFWTVQRQGDLLALGRMAWREMEGGEASHRAALVDARGRVMGFRLAQAKTDAWVDAPVPPFLHDRVTAAMKASKGDWLFADTENSANPMPNWRFQRRFRAARDFAAETARGTGLEDLAGEIEAVQFRDLRRTGMIAYRNAGAKSPWITALSGHFIFERRTILDTYMPGDTDAAIACVATGYRAYLARQTKEQQG